MKINDVVFEAAAMIPPAAAQTPAPGVAKAAPGVAPVKKGGTLDFSKFPGMNLAQVKQLKQANQAAARQAATAPAATQPAQPAQQQPAQQQPVAPATAPSAPTATAPTKAPSELDKPYDPVTGKGAKYDGVTGKPTPEYQKELDRVEAARLEKVEANRIASQARAKEEDEAMARLNQRIAQQNMPNVTQTTNAPTVATTDPAEVTAAMQAKIDAMKAKNPKLAAQMAAMGMDDMFNDKLAAKQPVQPAQPVAEDVQRMRELAGLAK